MARRVAQMLESCLPAALDGSIDDLSDVEALDDEVDALHSLLLEYLGRIGQEKLSEASSAELMDLFEAINALEDIGDIIETNIVGLGYQRLESSVQVSPETREVIGSYYSAVSEAFDLSLVAVTQKDQAAAHRVSRMKSRIKDLEQAATRHEGVRLVVDEPNRVATYRFEMDLITHLKRIFYFSRRIARVAVPEEQQAKM